MEQFVVLVIVGLVSLINWLLKRASEKREAMKLENEQREKYKEPAHRQAKRKRHSHPLEQTLQREAAHRKEVQSSQDLYGELMEALGLPTSAQVPKRRQSATNPDHHVEEEFASMEASKSQRRKGISSETRMAAQTPSRGASLADIASRTKRQSEAIFVEEKKPAASKKHAMQSVRSMLAGRNAQQQAVILAEVLGKPRGMADVSEIRWL